MPNLSTVRFSLAHRANGSSSIAPTRNPTTKSRAVVNTSECNVSPLVWPDLCHRDCRYDLCRSLAGGVSRLSDVIECVCVIIYVCEYMCLCVCVAITDYAAIDLCHCFC